MDARVNDFLNEINEIAPLSDNKEENVWEKCLDDDSGYYYYWNTKTNEVTWDMPSDYKSSKLKNQKINNLYIPPRTSPLFPSTSNLPPVSDAIKIYKIAESTTTNSIISTNYNKRISTVVTETLPNPKEVKKKIKSQPPRRYNDSDDEKIVLISSYGGDSEESEDEQPSNSTKNVNGSIKTKDDKKVVDISASVLKRAQDSKQTKEVTSIEASAETKKISGFSLVAGYSDSEDELETIEQNKPTLSASVSENPVSHSTLFPVPKPIDVRDFEEPESKVQYEESESGFSSKAFQRKRRIGVALVNTGKKIVDNEIGERKGLGFSSDSNVGNEENTTSSSLYPGFKSGGVMFVKSDVLIPSNDVDSNDGETKKITEEISKDVEEIYTTLKEKLAFLSEGRDTVSPVQVMLIQIETLIAAFKSGDLKHSYLKKWLDETCSDLIKLEKETTPEGWLLQWDRSHKRYYYQNEATGESQWEYPDVTGCDEAMDICTTPPPNGAEPTIHIEPPLPPVIRNPTPPPPPIISENNKNSKKNNGKIDSNESSNHEPLPPGVDDADVSSQENSKETDMNDVLNSFYSDIAAIETSNSPPVLNNEEIIETNTESAAIGEPAKKKKKAKVKLSQGIAMKKKGVSKLVEKWKNVQMSYND